VLQVLVDPEWQLRAAKHGPKFVAAQFNLRHKIHRTIDFYDRGRAASTVHLRNVAVGCAEVLRSGSRSVLSWLGRPRLAAPDDEPVLIPQRVDLR
jgi:hypothetical protein